jgi:FkbH-like protein
VTIQSRLMSWLPLPDAEALATLSSLEAENLGEDLSVLFNLSKFRWTETQLRKLGKTLTTALQRKSDFSVNKYQDWPTVRILVLSTATFEHMTAALVGTGLRHGLMILPTVIQYQNPRIWLSQQPDLEAFDFVFFCGNSGKAFLADDFAASEHEQQIVQATIDDTISLAKEFEKRCSAKIVIELPAENLFLPASHSDRRISQSHRRKLAQFHLGLSDAAAQHGYWLLDLPFLISLVGQADWWAGRFWHVGKLPFALDCVPLYLNALAQIVASAMGKSKRVAVLDLDNTLWGGVVGDDGLAGIVVGQGNAQGEAYLAIQKLMLGLKARGVILCIASKNTHDVAMDVFKNHPEMLLRESDFALVRANWQDKALNIRDMAETLNLGLEAFVFIDDNPAERKRVRDALPMVAVPDLPNDRSLWPLVLAEAGYFEFASVTQEDLNRSAYYQADARRSEIRAKVADETEFLNDLKMTLDVSRFDEVGRKRIVQLISKSNQFNLTGRRYSEGEVQALETNPQVVCLQARLSDIFGDNGMISCVVAKVEGDSLVVDLWIMSCRVIGRKVEEALLDILMKEARRRGISKILGVYIASPRNGIVKDHYQKLGFMLKDQDSIQQFWHIDVGGLKAKDLPFANIRSE